MPSLCTETLNDTDVDWDQPLATPSRAQAALDFMRLAMEQYATAGQPMWPDVTPPCSHAFRIPAPWRTRRGRPRKHRDSILAASASPAAAACPLELARCSSPVNTFPVLSGAKHASCEPALAPRRPSLIARPRFLEGTGSLSFVLNAGEHKSPELINGFTMNSQFKRRCEEHMTKKSSIHKHRKPSE